VAFDPDGLGEIRLPNYLETILYRIVCESIRNVVKHAKAKSVRVRHDRVAVLERG
jgi:signal transduction histidine kinase